MGLLTTLGLPPRSPAAPAAPAAARASGDGADAGAAGTAKASPDPARAAYEKAAAAIRPLTDGAESVLARFPHAPTEAQVDALDAARQAVDDEVAAERWIEAKAALPAWKQAAEAVVRAGAAHKAYAGAMAKIQADCDRADVLMLAAAPLPGATATAYASAKARVLKAASDRLWTQAAAAIPALQVAVKALLAVADAGRKFFDAFTASAPERDAALDLMRAIWDDLPQLGRFALAVTDYRRLEKEMRGLGQAKQWSPATKAVEQVRLAAIDLVATHAALTSQLTPFNIGLDLIRPDLERADRLAEQGAKALRENEGKTFTDALTATYDARDRGDFTAANAALDLTKAAMQALFKAHEVLEAERAAFEKDLAAVAGLNDAVALAGAAPPALAAHAAAVTGADAAVRQARFDGDWAAARAAVPALKAAVEALLKARQDADGAATPAELDALRAQLAALQPRIDAAAPPAPSTHVGGLQQAVRGHADAAVQSLKAGQLVESQVALGKLAPALDQMEQARQAFEALQAKVAAARDGAVRQARELALVPAELAKARDDALAEVEQDLGALADQGLLPQAEKRLRQWLDEAKAWKSAKPAYDSLHGDKPDAKKLAALTAQPGGGEVLDALVAQLPPDPPQDVMKAALKARFGFATQRFKAGKADKADTEGLKQLPPKTPDKPLKQVYATLSKIPARNVQGKVKKLVQYDQKAGGAMFTPGERGVYMYCGRPDDADAGKQQFNEPGKIVPPGEEVEDACKPESNDPVPYFDFALLHEVGHGEDEAVKFMDKRLANPTFGDWRKHTVADVAAVAAQQFGYDVTYLLQTLSAAGSKPPAKAPKPKKGIAPEAWEKAREAAVTWCRSVRVDNALWNNAALSKQVAIAGRVYQECYAGEWVSYAYAARAQGITGYQFRSHWEWFAELYAAYFSKRLKPNHPAASWLSQFDPPKS